MCGFYFIHNFKFILENVNKEKIISDYLSGKGTPQIAKELGCFPATIWYFLKQNNIPTRKNNRGVITKEIAEFIKESVLKGEAAYSISKKLGLSSASVLRKIKKMGLSVSHHSTQREDTSNSSKQQVKPASFLISPHFSPIILPLSISLC